MVNTELKSFVYQDYDLLNSCYSQLFGGRVVKTTKSNEEQSQNNDTISAKVSAGVDAGVNIFKNAVNVDAAGQVIGDKSTALLTKDGSLCEICPFDDLHDKLFNRLKTDGKLQFDYPNIGDYTLITGDISFINRDFLDVFVKNNDLQKYIPQDEKAISLSELKSTLRTLRSLLPYKYFAIVGGKYLVVVDEKYLRSESIASQFMLGGKISVFGFVCNTICPDCGDNSNIFTVISSAINSLLCNVLNKDELTVVYPISMYY